MHLLLSSITDNTTERMCSQASQHFCVPEPLFFSHIIYMYSLVRFHSLLPGPHNSFFPFPIFHVFCALFQTELPVWKSRSTFSNVRIRALQVIDVYCNHFTYKVVDSPNNFYPEDLLMTIYPSFYPLSHMYTAPRAGTEKFILCTIDFEYYAFEDSINFFQLVAWGVLQFSSTQELLTVSSLQC